MEHVVIYVLLIEFKSYLIHLYYGFRNETRGGPGQRQRQMLH